MLTFNTRDINYIVQVRRKTTHCGARVLLFELEQGVCQIRGIDAHALYEKVKNSSADKRKGILERTPYMKLSIAMRNKMVKQPKEGLVCDSS